MASFLAVYRGASIGTAQLVAVTADPQLIATVAAELLTQRTGDASEAKDAALSALQSGRNRALELVRVEAETVTGKVTE
jgi:hypothetical protein